MSADLYRSERADRVLVSGDRLGRRVAECRRLASPCESES